MQAFLISPDVQRIEAIDIATREDIVAQIGYDTLESDAIGDDGDTLYFDEECFLRGASGRFQIDSLIPVSGKGVVIGGDNTGALADVRLGINELRARTKFID